MSTMLRSLGLFLLLATASLAQTDTFYDFTVLYSAHSCEQKVNTLIRTQIHQIVVDIAGQSFDKPVYGHSEARRKLRTGSSPRELQDCDSPCGCAQYSACRIQPYFCADTCGGSTVNCECKRRLVDDEPRLLQKGDQCGNWNQGNLNYAEMDSILSCEATKYIKTAMAEIFAEENSCLGDSNQFEATVTVQGF